MITRYIELSCDHDGCDVAYAPAVDEITSVSKTRIGSLVAGWTRADGRDYCPDHQAPIVAELRELAAMRLSDDQIAYQLRVHRNTVLRLRKDNGIKPGLGRVGRPSIGYAEATR